MPGPDLFAEDRERDLYTAIDLVTKWGLGYAANTLWFGLGSGSGNDATLTLPASARTNHNTLAGTTGLFTAPRAATGLALGGDRTSLTTRNFDGHIAAVRCYTLPADDSLARRIASDLAAIYTHTAQPE